jgi:hypothetical protein
MEFHGIPNYTGKLYLPRARIKRNNWHSSCSCQPGTTLLTVARSELRRRSETQRWFQYDTKSVAGTLNDVPVALLG